MCTVATEVCVSGGALTATIVHTWNATHVVLKAQTSLTSKKSRVCSVTSRGRFICDKYTAAVAVTRCQDYTRIPTH